MTVSYTTSYQISVEAIVNRIFAFRQITPLDRQLLKSAVLSEKGLDDNDNFHINRVCQAIQNGLILVVE